MTLRTAKNLQYALAVIILLVFLPFAVCYLAFGLLYHYSEKVMIFGLRVNFYVGHSLLLRSDEAKNGTIKNTAVPKCDTASMAYRRLLFEENRNQNEN